MKDHHPRCATHRGAEFFCDCTLWDGSSRFAHDELFKFATEPTPPGQCLHLDLLCSTNGPTICRSCGQVYLSKART